MTRAGHPGLEIAYTGVTGVVSKLDDLELLLPSGCLGWTIVDLLQHLTLDAQRALIALHTPADGSPDVDSVSYWRGGLTASNIPHAQWVRRTAAAFNNPTGVVQRWEETANAAGHAARTADPAGLVSTQGHVLTVPDFVDTLITEAVIHHLDLIVSLPDAPEPAAEAVVVARATMEGLGGPLPAEWSPLEAVRKASGRHELTAADRSVLGSRAAQFPLIG